MSDRIEGLYRCKSHLLWFAKAKPAFAQGFERTESPSRLQGRALLDSKGKAFCGYGQSPYRDNRIKIEIYTKRAFSLIRILINENALFKNKYFYFFIYYLRLRYSARARARRPKIAAYVLGSGMRTNVIANTPAPFSRNVPS